MADFDQAINLDLTYAVAFHEKAKTLCLHVNVAGRERENLLGRAMKSLEDAVAIDKSIIRQINHEPIFHVLRNAPVYGPRLTALVSKPLSS